MYEKSVEKTEVDMKYDIIICGVGGQGTLSIATVIGEAATLSGLYLKQAEVHGMSQRGGAVQSHLRLSDSPIFSDLIPMGKADMILSMEPMEALRYVQYLAEDGVTVSSSVPFVNIDDYPEPERLLSEIRALGDAVILDIESIAKEAGATRSSNMVLLGAATKYLKLFSREILIQSIRNEFARKGESVVEANIKAFDMGYESIR